MSRLTKKRRDIRLWTIVYPLYALFAVTLVVELYVLVGLISLIAE